MKKPDEPAADVRFMNVEGQELALVTFDVTPQVEHVPKLSPAEREVLAAAMSGKSNRQIGAERGRSVRTVANQLAAIYRKHGVRSRSEMATLLSAADGRRRPVR